MDGTSLGPEKGARTRGADCLGGQRPSSSLKQMVLILVDLSVAVEDLAHLNRLPSVDDLRPCSCPLCGQASRPPGSNLGIVGNGTYRRQVLGLLADRESLVIFVRRYVCRGCNRTISVLPDTLLPWRWYAGTAMLLAVVLSLLQGRTADEVRRRLGQVSETPGWKTLDRWQRQLLAPLWGWMAAQIAFACDGPGETRAERCERLRRLAALQGAHARSPDAEFERAARALSRGSAHTRTKSWLIGHAA